MLYFYAIIYAILTASRRPNRVQLTATAMLQHSPKNVTNKTIPSSTSSCQHYRSLIKQFFKIFVGREQQKSMFRTLLK